MSDPKKPFTLSAPTPDQIKALEAQEAAKKGAATPPANMVVPADIQKKMAQAAQDPAAVSPEVLKSLQPTVANPQGAYKGNIGESPFKDAQDAYSKGYRLAPNWTWDPVTGRPVPGPGYLDIGKDPRASVIPQFEPLPGYDPNKGVKIAGQNVGELSQVQPNANMAATPQIGGGEARALSPAMQRTALLMSKFQNPDFMANYNMEPDLLNSLSVAMQRAGKVWGGGNENAKTRYQQGLEMALKSQEAANKAFAEGKVQQGLMEQKYNVDIATAENILPMEVKNEIEKATGIAWGTLAPDLKKIYAQAYVNLLNSKQDVAQGQVDPYTFGLKAGNR